MYVLFVWELQNLTEKNNETMENSNYTPYREQWKKEMLKLPKKVIIDMFAEKYKEQ